VQAYAAMAQDRGTTERRAGLLLCDLWDKHWCKSAAYGVERLAPKVAELVIRFRGDGGQIIHAPSDTLANYADDPARLWVQKLSRASTPAERPHEDPPLPAPPGQMCPDIPSCVEGPPWPWTREHVAIDVHPDDAVLESGAELLAVVHARSLDHIYIAGVHTNICILDRPFGIKQLVRWGISCELVSDLTEAMPATYTPLLVNYIRQHWCPAVESRDVQPTGSTS
jgi:nicotinamidase-related amidase